jgi:DNA repair photolyase
MEDLGNDSVPSAELTLKAGTAIHAGLQNIIDYRKSGLSLNHIVGCPLNCAYCVRHFFDNFEMKQPHILASDEDAVRSLIHHRFFVPHKTPIQLFNRATDPFLPTVRMHTHRVLKMLDDAKMKNLVLVITRYKVSAEDMKLLESLENVRLTLLFTYSGLNGTKIEPLPESVTVGSIKLVSQYKKRVRSILYWRPIVPGWNDGEDVIDHVLNIAQRTDAIAYTGLFYRPEQQAYFQKVDIAAPYESTHRRKILPQATEATILERHKKSGIGTPIFRKTSCAVAYAHGIADYNGHYGVPTICDICPKSQLGRCASRHEGPSRAVFQNLLDEYGYSTPFEIEEGHVWTSGLGEEKRYHLQHTLGFQVWDREWPHLPGQHGRAPLGYTPPVNISLPDLNPFE